MPLFNPAGIRVSLSSPSLHATTTDNVAQASDCVYKGRSHSVYVAGAVKSLDDSSRYRLEEKPVRTQGEALSTQLQYIGVLEDMPLNIAIVETSFSRAIDSRTSDDLDAGSGARVQDHKNEASESSPGLQQSLKSRYSPSSNWEPDLRALCLHVESSQKYPAGYSSQADGERPLEIKADVFYNGELCTSMVVLGPSALSEHKVHFSGKRAGRLHETPWALLATRPSANKEVPRASDLSILRKRWNDVGAMLKRHLKQGHGNSKDVSILNQYLESLVDLDPPLELDAMTVSSGQSYGIIDLVLTSGIGDKAEPHHAYITEPTPLRTKTFGLKALEDRVSIQHVLIQVYMTHRLTGISISPTSRP